MVEKLLKLLLGTCKFFSPLPVFGSLVTLSGFLVRDVTDVLPTAVCVLAVDTGVLVKPSILNGRGRRFGEAAAMAVSALFLFRAEM